jgi:hypothetical protein
MQDYAFNKGEVSHRKGIGGSLPGVKLSVVNLATQIHLVSGNSDTRCIMEQYFHIPEV